MLAVSAGRGLRKRSWVLLPCSIFERARWVFQRNIQFLEDYFRSDPGTVSPMARERVLGYVSAVAGLSLQALLHAAREFLSPDDIYLLIARDVLYVDLYAAPLVEPGKVFVFPTADSA